MIHHAIPRTIWIGLLIILICEVLTFSDVFLTPRTAIKTNAQLWSLPPPRSKYGELSRFMAGNITPIAWFGYITLLDGVLALQASGSPLRKRPHHFAMLCLASVPIWCVFDTFNFYSIKAWDYIGIPPEMWNKLLGYFLAFASIVPGMLMSGQMLTNFHLFDWARGKPWRMPRWLLWISFLVGLFMFVWPMIRHDPITNLTLWTSLVFLLDPINYALGRPSMWRDWSNGWYGRTLACFAGGLMCGLLWEFWNFWALGKWVYHLPFLGRFENVRYFEMPLLGLIGFLPFGIECWIMWQLIRVPLDGLVEELPDERTLL
jgi:hypothetical protein